MGQRSEGVKAVFDTNVLISALGWNGKPVSFPEAGHVLFYSLAALCYARG
jgi:hypothetical protein